MKKNIEYSDLKIVDWLIIPIHYLTIIIICIKYQAI